MRSGTFLSLAILSCAFLAAPGMADTVVPNALENVEGNSNNGFPFNIGRFNRTEMRYQQIFRAADFGSTELVLSGLSFRPDARHGSAFSTNLDDITIRLTTTGKAVDGLSTEFDLNYGADVTTVFDGDLFLSSADTGGTPRDFDIGITFSTPFVYDPNDGNLLLEIVNPNGTRTTQFDAAFRSGDALSRVFAYDADARFGRRDTLGLVTSFEATPNPEPGTLVLLGGAGLAFAFYRRRKNAAKNG